MPIQNYPRFLTKASKSAQQTQTGLPIVGTDGVSGDFNALKVNIDGSINVAGGGGGGATASNQVLQINQETLTNTKLDTLNGNVSQYSEQLNQSSYLLDIITNTTGIATASNQATIISNTTGIATASNQSTIITRLNTLSINSQWHTLCTKSFNANTGTHVWNLQAHGGLYPIKLMFTENGIEITSLLDKTGTNVLADYFQSTGTIIANAGQELICNGKTSNDVFLEITTTGNVHITAYYPITPYLAP
jgi:hypothetical protein